VTNPHRSQNQQADEDRGIRALVASFVARGKLAQAEADRAIASSRSVAGAQQKLNAAVDKLKQADEEADGGTRIFAKITPT
jgi:hypothetical protein